MTSFRVAVVMVMLTLGASSFAAPPPNDNFNNATALSGTNLTVTATNLEATKEVGEPNHSTDRGGKSVWWNWSAPASGSVLVQTTGSSFDTTLAAYTGPAVGNLNLLASNDDNGSASTSLIRFNVVAGTIYRLAVDGYGGAAGQIKLTLAFQNSSVRRPPNDNFADRILLSGPTVRTVGANYLASKEKDEPSHAEELGGASVWWTWTAPSSARVTISTEGSNFDTLLAVYTGEALTNLTAIASNEDISTNQPTSRAAFEAVARTAYQIAVDGYNGQPGDVQLDVIMSNVLWLDGPRRLNTGEYKVVVTGAPNSVCQIDGSTNLISWRPLTVLSNVTGVAEFIDAPLTNSASRFYRVQQVPER